MPSLQLDEKFWMSMFWEGGSSSLSSVPWQFIWKCSKRMSTTRASDWCSVRITTGSLPTDLISDRFGAAPFQEDLLYPAGTGHTETLRTLQFRPRVLGSISERGHSPSDRMVLWISGTKVMDGTSFTYFAGSVFILSKRARLAWAPLDRGSVWDFITSCLKSAPPDLFSFLCGRKMINQLISQTQKIQQTFDRYKARDNLLLQTGREPRFYNWFWGK